MRLGPEAEASIAPLYQFAFRSGRPPRRINGLDEIEVLTVARSDDPYSLGTMVALADRAAELTAGTLVAADRHGTLTESRLRDSDVAVVVTHNAQVSAVSAMLRSRGLDKVTVGTSDRLQGGQWHAVVALDPLCGAEGARAHSLELGRLCVMASRHSTHLTWVHDGGWWALLDDGVVSKRSAEMHRAVRLRLC